MKYFNLLFALLLTTTIGVSAQSYDDVFYTPENNYVDQVDATQNTASNYGNVCNNSYNNDYAYSYSSRIRRFRRNCGATSYYSPYYTSNYWYGGQNAYWTNIYSYNTRPTSVVYFISNGRYNTRPAFSYRPYTYGNSWNSWNSYGYNNSYNNSYWGYNNYNAYSTWNQINYYANGYGNNYSNFNTIGYNSYCPAYNTVSYTQPSNSNNTQTVTYTSGSQSGPSTINTGSKYDKLRPDNRTVNTTTTPKPSSTFNTPRPTSNKPVYSKPNVVVTKPRPAAKPTTTKKPFFSNISSKINNLNTGNKTSYGSKTSKPSYNKTRTPSKSSKISSKPSSRTSSKSKLSKLK